jgi:hypothetical protein
VFSTKLDHASFYKKIKVRALAYHLRRRRRSSNCTSQAEANITTRNTT